MLISIPTTCPSCASDLEMVNSQLFCRNKSCEAQSSKVLEGFCKKLKIKGFGAKTIEKIGISSITELYHLTEQDLVQALSAKMGSKLFGEIEKSKSCAFEDFIKSLGINLIGASASPKIILAFPTPQSACTFTALRDAGLGEKATESFLNYLDSERGHDEMDVAKDIFTFQVETQVASTSTQSSGYPALEICITGKLEDFSSRTAVSEHLSQFNITVKNSVTKNVQYLVCEDEARKASSSYKKALDKNIPIITIKELLILVDS